MAVVEYAGGGITSALNSASATTTVAVPLFTGTQANQPIIMAVASDASSGSWTTPSGWSVLMASIAVATDMVVAAYYKYSSGAESSTVTVTGPSGHMVGSSISLRCVTFGGSGVTPYAATIAATGTTSTSGPTTAGTLSPAVQANGLAVRILWCSSNSAGANGTFTPPAGSWTTRQKFINSSSSSAFCTGISFSTQLGAASSQATSCSLSSAWRVADSWFIPGAYPAGLRVMQAVQNAASL